MVCFVTRGTVQDHRFMGLRMSYYLYSATAEPPSTRFLPFVSNSGREKNRAYFYPVIYRPRSDKTKQLQIMWHTSFVADEICPRDEKNMSVTLISNPENCTCSIYEYFFENIDLTTLTMRRLYSMHHNGDIGR